MKKVEIQIEGLEMGQNIRLCKPLTKVKYLNFIFEMESH